MGDRNGYTWRTLLTWCKDGFCQELTALDHFPHASSTNPKCRKHLLKLVPPSRKPGILCDVVEGRRSLCAASSTPSSILPLSESINQGYKG